MYDQNNVILSLKMYVKEQGYFVLENVCFPQFTAFDFLELNQNLMAFTVNEDLNAAGFS